MQRSKSNEVDKEMDKTSELVGEALINAIRLAVREEIREALSQGGFSSDDDLLQSNGNSSGLNDRSSRFAGCSRVATLYQGSIGSVPRLSAHAHTPWLNDGEIFYETFPAPSDQFHNSGGKTPSRTRRETNKNNSARSL